MKKTLLFAACGLFVGAMTVFTTSCGEEAKAPVADSLLAGEWIVDDAEAANMVTLKLDTADHVASMHYAHDNAVANGRYDNYLRGAWAVQGADSLKLDFTEGNGNSSWSGYTNDDEKAQLEKLAKEGQENVKKANAKVCFITDLAVSGDTLTGKIVIDEKPIDVLYKRKK